MIFHHITVARQKSDSDRLHWLLKYKITLYHLENVWTFPHLHDSVCFHSPFWRPPGRPVLWGILGWLWHNQRARWGLSACILSSSGLTECPWNQTQHNTAEVSSGTTPAAPEQRRLCTNKHIHAYEKKLKNFTLRWVCSQKYLSKFRVYFHTYKHHLTQTQPGRKANNGIHFSSV